MFRLFWSHLFKVSRRLAAEEGEVGGTQLEGSLQFCLLHTSLRCQTGDALDKGLALRNHQHFLQGVLGRVDVPIPKCIICTYRIRNKLRQISLLLLNRKNRPGHFKIISLKFYTKNSTKKKLYQDPLAFLNFF